MAVKVLKYSILSLILSVVIPSYSQTAKDAVSYLQLINEQYQDIEKQMWDYTSTMAHSKSAKRVEKKRIDLINEVRKSIISVSNMRGFDNDYSLRDSVVSFLTLEFNVLNNDFSKIVDLEEVAEESYDLMEAFLLAQEKANEKLEIASEIMENQYKAFASKYGVNLVSGQNKISIKLKRSSEVLKYYNQVYLIFFKAFKQELYLMDALKRNDINAIEQNRNALITVSDEGIASLGVLRHFEGDNSINAACNKMLAFYKSEAESKIPILADFLLLAEEYEKMTKKMEAKGRMSPTNEEIKNYNDVLNKYNKGVNRFNETNNALNSKRNSNINLWNNSVGLFMERHIPSR
ncbi:MAG: hypothetical protein OEW75_00195 [Cyclobacteriaceae bacterium]|nr:hypothetical protein [Cyclobacteriaceae bacterium]